MHYTSPEHVLLPYVLSHYIPLFRSFSAFVPLCPAQPFCPLQTRSNRQRSAALRFLSSSASLRWPSASRPSREVSSDRDFERSLSLFREIRASAEGRVAKRQDAGEDVSADWSFSNLRAVEAFMSCSIVSELSDIACAVCQRGGTERAEGEVVTGAGTYTAVQAE
jgi:hypothetical protein